ncbi:MAG: hypothetical protein WCC36_09085 [Gammaproteobacteria bacterium]
MEITRTRRPAARAYAWLWKLVLAAGTVALGACSLPRVDSGLPSGPTAPVARPASAKLPPSQAEVETILNQMETAYDEVTNYQVAVEVIFFSKRGATKSQTCLYSFMKPNRIRLDFLSPNPGMIMVYPDADGKVILKPVGLLSPFTFHLALDDPLLQTPSGQQLNQTDLGTLIRNIRHSVTDQRRGPISISTDKDSVRIEVLADDHFRKGVATKYQFVIGKARWLPLEVDAATTKGVPVEKIVFRNFRENIDVPDGFFQ